MNKNLSFYESFSNLLMICGLHLIFFYTSYALISNFDLIISLPLFVLLSLIHHKFLGEFIHEGCHYHIYKNRWFNDLISNYFIGIFFFVSVKSYRKKHFKHHEYDLYFNPEDPETGPLKIYKKKDLWKSILFDLTGINGFKFVLNYINLDASSRSIKESSSFKIDITFLLILFFQVALFYFSIIYNFTVFYLVYYLTLGSLYHLQLRFRVICQHIFLNKENKIQYDVTTSRTIKGGVLENIFFTSDVTAYHNLHHKFPQYPFRKLKRMTFEKPPSEDKNIYSTTRYNIIFNYYNSLI